MDKKTLFSIIGGGVLFVIVAVLLVFAIKDRKADNPETDENKTVEEEPFIRNENYGITYTLDDFNYEVYKPFSVSENNGSDGVYNFYYKDKEDPDYSGLTVRKSNAADYGNSPVNMIVEYSKLTAEDVETETLAGTEWYVAHKTADNSTTVTVYYYACEHNGFIYLVEYELTGMSMFSNQGLNILKSSMAFKEEPVVSQPSEAAGTEE